MNHKTGRTDYNFIVSMVTAFEKKFKRKMIVRELITYIQKSKKIKLELAKQYLKDAVELKKISIEDQRIILRQEKGV